MRIEIENGKLAAAIDFMYGLKLTRKQSRMRRRFIEQMQERFKQVEDDRKQMAEEHSKKDSDEKPIVNDGNYDIKDMKAFSGDLKELYAEKLVIEGGDNREMIRTIQSVLQKFEDEEYEGKDSEIYDYLCDQFQIDEEEQEGEETNED